MTWRGSSVRSRSETPLSSFSTTTAKPSHATNSASGLAGRSGGGVLPGITTLQTRAKYFLLVPQMYRVIENRRASRKSAAAQIVELERALLARLKTSSDIAGVIGSRRWTVPQTPSSAIYWTGLHTWRIRSFSDARPRYHRWLDSGGSRAHLGLSEEDAGDRALWHEFIDGHDLLSNPNMGLTSEEAAFLRTRILAIKDNPKRSLLKDLAASGPLASADFLWDVVVVADGAAALSAQAHDAHRLSAALHGAMLHVNYRFASRASTRRGSRLGRRGVGAGGTSTRDQRGRAGTWSPSGPACWHCRAACRPCRSPAPSSKPGSANCAAQVGVMPAERESARRAVERREKQVKRNRARLIGGPALRTWDGAVGVGADPMRFRWPQAARILHRDLDRVAGG